MPYTLSEFKRIIEAERKIHTFNELSQKYGLVNVWYFWNLVHSPGYVPPDHVLAKWNIKTFVSVQIVGGQVVEGAELISVVGKCNCGQAYISNHPKRKRCFTCSPYRGAMI